MKIDAAIILELRLKRAWTQDELAIASGLSLRTIQRIEKEKSASLESKKALAAALDIDVIDLDYEESPTMTRYEYKTVEMPFKERLFSRDTPDIENLLNAEGDAGWRLHQIVLPASSSFGQTEKMVAILEREVES